MNFIGTGYALHDMQELTRELGLSAHVAFHGVIDNREDLRRFYAASDLFLFPSFYDNAPLVVREAAAMSTPPFCSKALQPPNLSETEITAF